MSDFGLALRRVGDHRREIGLGRDLAVEQGAAGKFAHARPLLNEFDLEPEQATRLNRNAELRAFDRHEIDELAGPGKAEGLDCQDSGGLRQRFDDQHARHHRSAREMTLEKALVDRHCFDGDDPRLRVEAFDPVDEEHRIAVRQRRHDPLDIQRACRAFAHRPPCAGAVCCCGIGVTLTDGNC